MSLPAEVFAFGVSDFYQQRGLSRLGLVSGSARTTHHASRNTLYPSGVDGHLQRQALTAAERAIEALGRKDPGGARSAVATAVERDQVGLFGVLADAVHLAATELEKDGELSEATWNTLADAVGPGPLQGLVESIRD